MVACHSSLLSSSSPSGGGVDDWNPMADDYNSRSFNSYVSGPGLLLESSRRVSGESSRSRPPPGNITLFVDNIPLSITKVSVLHAVDVIRRKLVRGSSNNAFFK